MRTHARTRARTHTHTHTCTHSHARAHAHTHTSSPYTHAHTQLQDDGQRVKSYSGLIPPVGWRTLLELHFKVVGKVNKLAKQVPLDNPWACPHAREWDGTTVDSYVSLLSFSPCVCVSLSFLWPYRCPSTTLGALLTPGSGKRQQ